MRYMEMLTAVIGATTVPFIRAAWPLHVMMMDTLLVVIYKRLPAFGWEFRSLPTCPYIFLYTLAISCSSHRGLNGNGKSFLTLITRQPRSAPDPRNPRKQPIIESPSYPPANASQGGSHRVYPWLLAIVYCRRGNRKSIHTSMAS